MTRLGSRAALGALLPIALFSACGVDSRGLTYEFHALDAAGSSSGNGSTSSGSSAAENAGDDSAAGAGEGGKANPPSVDSSTQGGSSTVVLSGGAAADAPSAGASSAGTSNNGGAAAVEPEGGTETGVPNDDSPLDECGDSTHTCGPTLVQNARFDSAATGWIAEQFMAATWDPTDSASSPSSGSLLLHDTAPVSNDTGYAMTGADQCIPTEPDTGYDVALRLMIAAGQTNGSGGMNVFMYDDTACQGNLVSAGTPFLGGSVGQWSVLQGTLWVPGDVHSLSIRLVASKPFTQSDLKIFFDDVLFAKH